MSMFIASLNSGSNANCYYVGNRDEAILVDAGLSCRETEKRMERLGLAFANIRAIFISHEHSDHITGLAGLSKKYKLPVYITEPTFRNSGIPLLPELVNSFEPGKPLQLGSLFVTPFCKSHDAVDPHSFIIQSGHVTIGVFTDIGHVCKEVIHYFKQCDAVFLESNYCNDMLENGRYPYFLKQRIRGNNGHLSNTQALELFIKHRPKKLSHLILSHLSKNNNCPELVDRLFRQQAGDVMVTVASRYEASPVYHIERGMSAMVSRARKLQLQQASPQLSLF